MKARRSKGENVEKQNFGKVLYLVFILPCTELPNLLVKTRNLRLFRNSDTTKRWPGNTGASNNCLSAASDENTDPKVACSLWRRTTSSTKACSSGKLGRWQ